MPASAPPRPVATPPPAADPLEKHREKEMTGVRTLGAAPRRKPARRDTERTPQSRGVNAAATEGWDALAGAAATAAVRIARAGWPELLERFAADPAVRAGLADLAGAAARLAGAAGGGSPSDAAPTAEPGATAETASPPPAPRLAETPPAVPPPAAAPAVETPPPPVAPPPPELPPASIEEIQTRLTLGSAPPPPAPAPTLPEPATEEPPRGPVQTEDVKVMPLLPARCRVKAATLRWAAQRAKLGTETETLRTQKEDLRAEADAAGSSPWPLFDPPPPGDHAPPAKWERAAATFEVLGGAADHLHAVHARYLETLEHGGAPGHAETDALHHALDLAAEAQSMALLAVRELSELADRDQKAVYKAIRDISSAEIGVGYYIRHYLREGSSADPAGHADLAARVASADAARTKEKKGRELFKKLAHACEKYADHRAAADGGDDDDGGARRKHAERADYHAGRAAKFAADLLARGTPPSDVRFREALPTAPAPLAGLEVRFADADDSLARVFEYLPAARGSADARKADGDDDAPAAIHAASVDEALEKAQREWPDAFSLAFNGRSEPSGYPFKDADQFYRGLKFLAGTFRDAKANRRNCPDLVTACKEQTGLDYSPNQSPSTMGEFPEYYRTLYEGEEVPLKGHIGRGNNKDPRLSFRLAFYYDKDRDKVVLGYLGQHQRTRAT